MSITPEFMENNIIQDQGTILHRKEVATYGQDRRI